MVEPLACHPYRYHKKSETVPLAGMRLTDNKQERCFIITRNILILSEFRGDEI